MKKTIILALMLTAFSLSSCKKEDPTFCWECTEAGVTFYSDGTFNVEVFDIDTECGVTEEEIKLYEKEYWYGDYYMEITTCTKQ